MKKMTGKMLVLLLIICLMAGFFGSMVSANVPAAPLAQSGYTWKNVEIIGTGFIPGIIFNSANPNVVYARTDMGGAYRLNPTTRRWIPLTDFVSDADYNLIGIESIATDPVDPNRVYLAAGTYLQSWASNGVIFRSTDQGNTFSRVDMPFKMGGNEPGRSIGERLMVDPNKNSIIYFGTRNDGLWKSADFGASWAKVQSFPVNGNANLGVGWVIFDKASGAPGNTTQTIYVGVITNSNAIYRSTDGGSTWTALAGQPSNIPHHGYLTSTGILYVTYGDQPGPYEMYGGTVHKYNVATGVWTNITPLVPYQNGEQGFGYAGLAVDASNPNVVMVATLSRWGPIDEIFRSTDGGATWKGLTPNKTMDVSASPFLNWEGPPNPKLGWMIGDLEIDPFNSNRILYGTGATIFGSDNITALDTDGVANIVVRAQGIEESAVLGLISPPTGAPLVSVIGDVGGFTHNDLTVSPPGGMTREPIFGSGTGIDFAELNPSFMVRVGKWAWGQSYPRISYSTDGGTTWVVAASEPPNLGDVGGGTVAVSANGNTIVWSPENAPVYYSRDRGVTWTAVSGLSNGTRVVADRANSNKFYAWNSGLSGSTDGGATFSVKNSQAWWGYVNATTGRDGDVWLAADGGNLFHSTDSGVTLTAVGSFTSAEVVGFGKAATGQTYPAIYVVGIVGGVHGIYRSDDAGATWVRINDDQHRWGWIGKSITGDPRIYGRVYIATNGRGIIYGDIGGGATPTPTRTSAVTNTPTRTNTPVTVVPTNTPTRTNTPLTVAPTNTPTRTSAVTNTPTRTPTRTATGPTPTRTRTRTPTRTPTGGTPLPTSTPTRTNTPATELPTNTPTRTSTPGPTPTPTPTTGGACSPVTSTITAPFTFDGAGAFCWQSSSLGTSINSWNTTSVTLNGVNVTNLYVASGSYPAQIGGYWYVGYNSSVAWGHFEAK